MEPYLSMIQNNPLYAAIVGAVVAVFASFLLMLSVRARYRRQVKQLEHEIIQARVTLQELNDSTRDFEAQLADIQTAFDDQQIAQTTLESSLSKLQAKNRSYKNYIGRLELAKMKIFNDLNLAKLECRQLTEVLSEQAVNSQSEEILLALENKNQAYKRRIESLTVGRMALFNDVNAALLKSRQLTAILAQQADYADQVQARLSLETESQADKAQIANLETERAQISQDLEAATQKIHELEAALAVQAEAAAVVPAPAPKPAAPVPAPEPIAVASPEPEPKPVPAVELQAPAPTPAEPEPAAEAPVAEKPFFSKLLGSMNLGGFGTQSAPEEATPPTPEPEPIAQEQPEIAPPVAETVTETKPSWLGSLTGQLGQAQQAMNGLQQRWRKPEPEVVEEVVIPEPEPEPEVVVEEKPLTGQLKGLYSKLNIFSKP
jgi:hypothetical protein